MRSDSKGVLINIKMEQSILVNGLVALEMARVGWNGQMEPLMKENGPMVMVTERVSSVMNLAMYMMASFTCRWLMAEAHTPTQRGLSMKVNGGSISKKVEV